MAQQWYVKGKDGSLGPYTAEQLKAFAERDKIKPQTSVRLGSDGKWIQARQIKGLVFGSEVVDAEALASTPVSELFPATALSPKSSAPSNDIFADLASSGSASSFGAPSTAPPLPGAGTSGSSNGMLIVLLVGVVGGLVMFGVVGIFAVWMLVSSRPQPIAQNNPPAPSTGKTSPTPSSATGDTVVRTSNTNPSVIPTSKPLLELKPLSTEEIVAKTESSVALIKGRVSSGTGFVVADGMIATNKHVISSELIKDLEIHFPSASKNKGPYKAELLYKDPKLDLAMLYVDSPHEPLKIAQEHEFKRGQEVIVIGSPGFTNDIILENAISRGVVSTQVQIGGRAFYQLGISINSGNSGGPVLDKQGQVLGVVTLKAALQEGLGFCIPPQDLLGCIDRKQSVTTSQMERLRAEHNLQVVFLSLNTSGIIYKHGMQSYTDAMQKSLENGQRVAVGLKAARAELDLKISMIDEYLMGDLQREISIISTDTRIPSGTRQKFVDLWGNYKELKSYVENPRGNFDSYRDNTRRLSDEHERLTKSLATLLGMEDELDE